MALKKVKVTQAFGFWVNCPNCKVPIENTRGSFDWFGEDFDGEQIHCMECDKYSVAPIRPPKMVNTRY